MGNRSAFFLCFNGLYVQMPATNREYTNGFSLSLEFAKKRRC